MFISSLPTAVTVLQIFEVPHYLLNKIRPESPFECMCNARAYSFLCHDVCRCSNKIRGKCQLSKIYLVFIRKLLCAVTLSRQQHFHVVTTAPNARMLRYSLCSVHIKHLKVIVCQQLLIAEGPDVKRNIYYNSQRSQLAQSHTVDICFIIHGENESKFPAMTKFSTKQLVEANVSPFSHKVYVNFTQIASFCIAQKPLSVPIAASQCGKSMPALKRAQR